MRRIKILLPCALSILALCAVAPADSSALLAFPEIGRCVKVAPGTGAYALATCTGGAKGGGEFEWQPGLVKPKFLGKGGITVLETIGGLKIECKTWVDGGEYGSPDDILISVHLMGCQDLAIPFECHNAAPEEIFLGTLEIETDFIQNHLNKEGKPVVSIGAPFGFEEPTVNFECGPNKNQFTLSGIAIATVVPIDKMTAKVLTLKLVQKSGKQMPNKFEGGVPLTAKLQQTFPLLPKEQAGLSATFKNTNEEPLEFKGEE
jgi:hypothetical protein